VGNADACSFITANGAIQGIPMTPAYADDALLFTSPREASHCGERILPPRRGPFSTTRRKESVESKMGAVA
jgi:hypothetical protein